MTRNSDERPNLIMKAQITLPLKRKMFQLKIKDKEEGNTKLVK